MAKFIHFTDEQKQRANNVDLVDFLRSQGEEVIRAGHEYRWKAHDSVTIKGNRWYQHSAEQGGCAINFVQEFYNLPFPDAVTMLLNGERGQELKQAESVAPKPSKPFALPEPNANMRRVYAYLMKQRCIDAGVISHFAKAKTLYEDARFHNAVFVGVDENGEPRQAHKKSTYSLGGSFRGNVDGSDSRYSFGHIGITDRIYVFEAPIDMLSFISLYKMDWQRHSYIALNGVSEHALMHTLQNNPHLSKPILCLDNDKAGLAAMERIGEKLKQAGYEDVSRLLSHSKDWNLDLQTERGMQEQRQEMKICM